MPIQLDRDTPEPGSVHFAPYGGVSTTCGEVLPKGTPWSFARANYGSRQYTTRRAETTCPQCRSALKLDQESASRDLCTFAPFLSRTDSTLTMR